MSSQPAVRAIDLVKRFGDHTAVDHVSFVVPEGTVLGPLGPNGAGKTTTVRMLTTLSVPTSGTGHVAGHDVIAKPDAVRRRTWPHRAGGHRRRAAHRAGEPPAHRAPLRALTAVRRLGHRRAP